MFTTRGLYNVTGYNKLLFRLIIKGEYCENVTGCEDKNSSYDLIGSPGGSSIDRVNSIISREKPTVTQYTYYIDRHAGTPNKRQKHTRNLNINYCWWKVGYALLFVPLYHYD